MTNDEQKALFKEAYKEASKEWLNEITSTFGKWALKTIAASLVVAIGYFMLMMMGWHK